MSEKCNAYLEYFSGLELENVKVRKIMQDLIAEMRELHIPYHGGSWDTDTLPICDQCSVAPSDAVDYPCPSLVIVDRAEARLNELNGESK